MLIWPPGVKSNLQKMGKNCKIRWGAGEKRVPDGHKKSQYGIVGREEGPKASTGAENHNGSAMRLGTQKRRQGKIGQKLESGQGGDANTNEGGL